MDEEAKKILEEKIALHERLARIEELLKNIADRQAEIKETQKECDEKLEKKIDKIMNNDVSKLQRIAKVEERAGNMKTLMWFVIPMLLGALARWLVF